MKLVGYLRVSTATQAEDGLGLEVQEQAIRKWAKKEGHRLVSVMRDEGISGSNGIDTRIALHEALEAIKARRASGLVVYRLDRLARDLILQEQLLADIRRMGGEVFSTSAAEGGYLADDPDDPSRRLIRQVLGAVSEYERSMISLRLKAGQARKRENGGYAAGAPPYGYIAQGRALVEHPQEQEVLSRIAQMKREGLSLRGMADALTAEGFRPRRGARWHPESLNLIVRRLERV